MNIKCCTYIDNLSYKKIKNHHTSGQSNSDCNVTYINNGDITIHINKILIL